MGVMNIQAVSFEIPYIEELIGTYLNHVKIEYEKFLFLSWGFSISDKDPNNPLKIGPRIDLDKGNFLEPLKKYCGIELDFVPVNDVEDVFKRIIEDIEDRKAVIATVQSMYLPYHRTFGDENESHPHDILVCGISDSEVFVMDPGWFEGAYGVNIENFKNALFEKVGFFNFSDKIHQFDEIEVLEAIIKKVTSSKNGYKDMFSAIESYADLMINEFNIKNEVSVKDYNNESLKWEPFITRMTRIDGQRYTMSIVFKYLYKRTNENIFLEISKMYIDCVKKWAHTRYGIYRSIISNSNDKFNNSVLKLKDIANFEREILDKIIISKELLEDKKGKIKIFMIDLTSYYNFKFFRDLGSKESNIYFLRTNMPSNDIINVEGIQFKFPDLTMPFDCISCNGQKISVEIDNYIEIDVLGFAIHAGYVDDIVVNYDDGTNEYLELALNDYLGGLSRYGEIIAINAQHYSDDILGVGCIYCTTIKVDNKKKISSIILPDWSKLCILSISLKK